MAFQYQVCCDQCKTTSQQASPNTLPPEWLSVSLDDTSHPTSRPKELSGEKTFCSVDCMVTFINAIYFHGDVALAIRTRILKGGKLVTQTQQGKTS